MKQSRFDLMKKTKDEVSRSNTQHYSGDKPNKYLTKFIEEQMKANPYHPSSDDYDISAFNKSITTTKTSSIYNMHTYWAKKPHSAIKEYILHFSRKDDTVLDPFCGSGGTALISLMNGRNAIAIDLSPAATFITKNYCTPINHSALKREYDKLYRRAYDDLIHLYHTVCDRCNSTAIIKYVVYSYVYQCIRCLNDVSLYECIDLSGKKYCPICYKNNINEEISPNSNIKKSYIPVEVVYECKRCKPKRRRRNYIDKDERNREYFYKYDIKKINEINETIIPYWYPNNRMMNTPETQKKWGTLYRKGVANYQTVDEIYTNRALIALSTILHFIKDIKDGIMKDFALFSFSASLLNCSLLYRHRSIGGGSPTNLSQPQIFREMNVLDSWKRKMSSIVRGNTEKHIISNKFIISTESATTICKKHNLPSNCIDYIFTDPPYSDKYPFGQLNFIWESWLQFDTNWHGQEIIVAEDKNIMDHQKRSKKQWKHMMKEAMECCYHLLKPNRWLSLCYHDTSPESWKMIQDIMLELHFIPDNPNTALYIDTTQKTHKQRVADTVTKRDLVINFRKPKPGEVKTFISFSDGEDPITFNQKVYSVITDYLSLNPGSTKDFIYDDLISRMVRRGQMQSHNFEMLLNQIAVSSVIRNYSGLVERWYLKETQIDAIDQAETAREDAAAESVIKFILKSIESNPAEEGAHYSDIFEHYIYAVQDKPRRELRDWLVDYFYVTPEGTYRPPMTEEEERLKQEGREKGLSRRIRRFVSMVENGVPVPEGERPDGVTLVEWILHCRRSGLFSEGRVLYERGGLSFDDLSEETQVEVEEAYYSITKQGGNVKNVEK